MPKVTARTTVLEGSAAVYYTLGADAAGVYRNARVLWELYGPQDEDYRFLLQELRGERQPRVSTSGDTHVVEIDFQIDRPGTYRLRAATVDLAGRTAVTWKRLTLSR